MAGFTKPVSLSLIMLWTHERGEFATKHIAETAVLPVGTLVDEAGAPIDPTPVEFDATTTYGVVFPNGMVYHSWSIFNDKYILWPEGIDPTVKQAITDHLANKKLIIKAA